MASVDIRKQWSVAQENLLQELAQRCQSRSVMHGMEYRVYKRLNTLITVPSIVITLFGGAASTSQSSLIDLIGPSSEKYVPLVIGVLSMFVSIMGSISSFMKIPALTEQHLQAHVSFGKLTRKISSEIQVSPCDRSMAGREACKKYEEMFVALMDIAPPVSRRTEARFSSRSDVKALKMAVPPLVKMAVVKTFTQLETERALAVEKAKAQMKAEIERASRPPQPPKLLRGLSRKNIEKRTRVEPERNIEIPPMNFDTMASMANVVSTATAATTAATGATNSGIPKLGGMKKQKKALRNELSSIARAGTVSRLASEGGLNLEEKESSSDSDSNSEELEVRAERSENSLDV